MEEERQIVGNDRSRRRTEALLDPGSRIPVSALTGPEGLGKRTFLLSELGRKLEEPDLLVVGSGVDGAREASSFLDSSPLFSPYRAVVVDGSDPVSEPAQDAYLKLCEEPPPSARVFFVVEDEGLLLPALRSRIQEVVRWSPLDGQEMGQFIESHPTAEDPEARRLCRGIPALYDAMLGKPEFPALLASVSDVVGGRPDPLSLPVPEVVKLTGKDRVGRTAVASVCRQAALSHVGSPGSRPRIRAFLRFASVLCRHPSANAEVHWQRTMVACLL